GSVAVEWVRASLAMLPPDRARAYAIEPRADRLAKLATNNDRLAGGGVTIIEGRAPGALTQLPAPDAVFIGGAVANDDIFSACWDALRPGGRCVANAVTLEGDAALIARHGRLGGSLTRIDIAVCEPVGPLRGMRPRMSVLQWRAVKEAT
ncbi:MAG: cobalamin biosynthesis bifunctional protein CbiET, partial [Pseudomonadota bacterium]